MELLQARQFDIESFKYITNFDYEKYKDEDLDLELTADEKRLVEYVEVLNHSGDQMWCKLAD